MSGNYVFQEGECDDNHHGLSTRKTVRREESPERLQNTFIQFESIAELSCLLSFHTFDLTTTRVDVDFAMRQSSEVYRVLP
jgi:hypothetical protein